MIPVNSKSKNGRSRLQTDPHVMENGQTFLALRAAAHVNSILVNAAV